MTANNSPLNKVREAIINLKKGKNKLTISSIANKAGISRKTIYNRPELKQVCDQAIELQRREIEGIPENKSAKTVTRKTSSYFLLEERYKKLREKNKELHDKNAMLLHNNKELVLEKEQLKSKILLLEEKIERMNKQKVKSIK